MRLVSLCALLATLTGCDDGSGVDQPVDGVVDNDNDGIDAENDCDDDNADVGLPTDWFLDIDRDGYGDPQTGGTNACTAPGGYVLDATDCDDRDPRYNPGALEDDCSDPRDYNCDGNSGVDDVDGDGFAACEDCDDNDPDWNPDTPEYCNGIDDNCNGVVDGPDALDPLPWYADTDADGWGDEENIAYACNPPEGYLGTSGDCDDAAPLTKPDGIEVCDDANVDENCNNFADDDDATLDVSGYGLWFRDVDRDGFGTPDTTTVACDPPVGYSAVDTDCDDAEITINPGATEVCDNRDIDQDCDGLVDELDDTLSLIGANEYYADVDLDGYGDPESTTLWCVVVEGYVENADDCNPDDARIHPAATERCDGVDEDCDGEIDDGVPTVWYSDVDGDSFGDIDERYDGCHAPEDWVTDATDCQPADPTSYPRAVEICDGIDNDCDTRVDEGRSCGGGDVYVVFDHCGATGYAGPTQEQCDTTYAFTDLDGEVTVTSGLQTWIVPEDGDYRIEAWGAIGASGTSTYVGGSGAYATGVFGLSGGDELTILVGQRGTGVASGSNGGGGGGTFVVVDSTTPLVIAGGGGGTRTAASQNGCDGRGDQYGGTGSGGSSTSACGAGPGTLGGGGAVSSGSWGSGGGGFNTAGSSDTPWGVGGASFLSGGSGGTSSQYGGFGGGGSGNGSYGGGGGGGYTGGQGGWIGGGAGSYVGTAAEEAEMTAGANADDGQVTIERI